MSRELVRYVRESLKEGYSEEQIRRSLRQNGWNDEDINYALQRARKKNPAPLIVLGVLFLVGVGVLAWLFLPSDEQPPINPGDNGPGDENLSGENSSAETNQCTTIRKELEKYECYKELAGEGYDCQKVMGKERQLCYMGYEGYIMDS